MTLDILEGDLCSLSLVILLLLWAGHCLAEPRDQHAASLAATLALLAYAAFAWRRQPPSTAEELLALTVRALIAAGLALGLATIAAPLFRRITGTIRDCLRKICAALQAKITERRRQLQVTADSEAAAAALSRSAPDLESLRRESEARAQAVAVAQRRRDDARVAAEVLFALHQHDIAGRFNAEMFADFCKKYMGDDRAPEYVEERSQQLQSIIQQLVEKSLPAKAPRTLVELDHWFKEQKSIIDNSGLSDTDKKIKLLHLQKRYDDLFTRVIHGA